MHEAQQSFYLYLFLIEVYLIKNIALISGV